MSQKQDKQEAAWFSHYCGLSACGGSESAAAARENPRMAKHDQQSFITSPALTLHRHLDHQQGTLDEDDHTPCLGDGEEGGEHAEHPVDVAAGDGDGGEEGVQVVRDVEGMGKFLDLDECGEGGDDGEGEDDDFCSRVNLKKYNELNQNYHLFHAPWGNS